MSRPKYNKTENRWQFRLDGTDVLFEASEIGIIYSKGPQGKCSLIKHGPKKTIEELHAKFEASQANIAEPHRDQYHILDVTEADPENLNRIINHGALEEKDFHNLSQGKNKPLFPPTQYVPLTRDTDAITQHLIAGGKILVDNPLEKVFKTFDLDLILEEANVGKINPKEYTNELIVWPDGTECSTDDFIPEEWTHRSDDYETVNDMDEDTRDFLQKTIEEGIGKHRKRAQILQISLPNGASAAVGRKTQSAALQNLPITPPENKSSEAEVQMLRNQEATTENEETYRNAKRNLARDAVAQNLPPDRTWHHLPAYRAAAQAKILASPEPAKLTNIRLEILELEIEKSLGPEQRLQEISKQLTTLSLSLQNPPKEGKTPQPHQKKEELEP